ncbi:MAG: hypothetical protein MI923_30565 [Phycisphaerales bacterium]|nr:hypothetical protein [Phycisphaerales bacterium]
MLPNKRLPSPCVPAFFIVITTCSLVASAHQVVELRGEIKLTPRKVSMLLEPDTHTLGVLGNDREEFGVRQCAKWLSQSVRLRDRYNERHAIASEVAGSKIRLNSVVEPSSWPLSLRWMPRSAGRILRGRISLSWEIGDVQGNVLLTSGGNVVCLDAAESPPGPPRDPAVTIDTRTNIRVTVRLPLVSMAPMFDDLLSDENYLSSLNSKKLDDVAATKIEQMLNVRSNRRLSVSEETRTELSIRGTTRDPTRPTNMWLTEIEWSRTWGCMSGGRLEIEISPDVLILSPFEAKVIGEGGMIREGVLTSTDPSVAIMLSAKGERVSIGRRSWFSEEDRRLKPMKP